MLGSNIIYKATTLQEPHKWVRGHYVVTKKRHIIYKDVQVRVEGAPISHGMCDYAQYSYKIQSVPFDVIPETVRMSSGICDSKGELIFEEDILRDLVSGAIWLVKYGYCGIRFSFTGWFCVPADGDGEPVTINSDYAESDSSPINRNLEIIGNSIDNPEMLIPRAFKTQL